MVSGGLLLAAAVLLLGIVAMRTWPATPVAGDDPLPSNVAATVPPDAEETLPPDEFGPGTEVRPLDSEGTISRDQALDIARRSEYPEVFEQGHVEAYLVELTGPQVYEGVQDRPIWLIKATGLSLDIFDAPLLADGTRAEVGLAHLAYIYIDAITGEWLTSSYQG
jgi:hypothetical protein